MTTDASTVEAYLAALPPDREGALRQVRQVILDNLASGFAETVSYSMLTYVVPLERYPTTYNKQPLMYAALGAKKNYLTVHLLAVQGDGEDEFRAAYARTGKKLDMGKSCIRFRTLDALALEPVARAVARYSVDDFIARYESSRVPA